MKSFFFATVCGIAISSVIGGGVRAEQQQGQRQGQGQDQGRNTQSRTSGRAAQAPQERAQFTDTDRQTTRDWNSQHQAHPSAGFRATDRLSPDQESRLQPGRPLDADLRKREHPVPADLAHRLPPPPRNNRYVAIGGHVGLVDSATQTLLDVIHLH